MENEYVLSGRYALKSHLARGGMAEVYIAQDRLLGRQVAVKILHDQFSSDRAFVERFRREAMAAGNLSHPNIVGIYDWGRDDDTYYMVMELIQGRNLRDVLRTEGALLPRRVAEIGVEVAAALSVAHESGLVHRDIKPANVLLTPDGNVKVTDFGIARAWNDSDDLTRTGAVIGTATYFSPEQAQGLPADARSDVYALGVVMYELLTGRPPFQGESPVSVAYQHVREPVVPPSMLNPDVPATFDAVVMQCLQKNPEHRYQSSAALAADLRRLLAGQVPAAAPENEAPTRMMAAIEGTGPPTTPPPSTPRVAYDVERYAEPSADRTTLIIGILGALAVLGIGLILLVRLLGPQTAVASEVEVPDVSGMQRATAAQLLGDLGFQVQEQEVPDGTVPIGQVIRTDPQAGTIAREGDPVTVFVSSGPSDVEVPRVIGADLSAATATLENAGLAVSAEFEGSDTVEQNIVISQSPEPGQTVEAGTTVRLIVSGGTQTLQVPDVTNRSERDALVQLEQAGFTPGQIRVEREPSKDILEGFVISTDPAAGGVVPANGIVRVIISDGAVPTVVPNVVGQLADQARFDLEELGFEVLIGEPVELPYGDPEDGRVQEQDPEPGEVIDYGNTVTLRIGEAAEVAEVPDVGGMTPDDARVAIEAAGLLYSRGDDVPLAAGDPDIGRVVLQDPAPATQVDPDTTITVRVGVAGVQVPDVTSSCMTAAEAQAAIEAAGLVYEEVGPPEPLPTGDPCEGRVVEQSPGPYAVTGDVVASGTTVQVRLGEVLVATTSTTTTTTSTTTTTTATTSSG